MKSKTSSLASSRQRRAASCVTLGRATFALTTIVLAVMFSLLGMRSATAAEAGPKLELSPGDRISIIGNTLADRMQHDGWLETYIQARFPKHGLVIRNLGFAADEVVVRLRSAGFGSPDDHLKHSQTDVILACFGYNESFAGEAGLPKFKDELAKLITHMQGQLYNGKSAPRIILCSPIAHENLGDANLPDGTANNARLKLYMEAMRDVAAAQKVVFVDLFTPTRALYETSAEPCTINGIHLNEQGNRALAGIITSALFGAEPPAQAANAQQVKRLAEIRTAVLEKNFYWFNRYRTVDGYSIYGGRADLKFVDGQTNRVVMQREMEILDVMTANRDRRIWAAANGNTVAIDDRNAPPFLEVVTNKPGPLPGGKHVFLGGEEAIGKMQVHKGMKVSLFASEEQFPDLANPVQMTFDPRGRLWVAVMPSYPHWKPDEKMTDKVIILEDTNQDGRADKCITFADGLHVPTGLELWNGGLLLGQQPDVMFLKDTNGDDVADVQERVVMGLDSADTHHAMSSFVLDPGGAIYFQEGTFHHTQVETPWGPPVRSANAAVFRYEPRTQKFEVYVPYGFANPHGHVFDRWGQDFVTDGTGAVNYFAAAFSGHLPFPQKHAGVKPFFQQRTRPCPATEILSSAHFPPEMQGNYLIANVIGVQGILQYKFRDDGSGFAADEVEPIVLSTDPSFRPVDLEIGPDGSLFFIDWQNPIIGHMQHNLRDPSRDRTHGRVYRVTMEGRPLATPAQIAGQPIDKLLALLESPEDRVRYRARIELSSRKSDEVIAAATAWIARLDPQDVDYAHHLLEGLWVHQAHNRVDTKLLKQVLALDDPRARAAATRVLCYWRDRVSDSLDLLRALAADEHPRVRLEAVRAASFYTAPEAVEVVLIAAELPGDYYLDYVKNETLKALDPYWKEALAKATPVAFTTDVGNRYLLRNMSLEQLLAQDRTRAVYRELLFRPAVRDELRAEAISALAKIEQQSELAVLLGAITSLDGQKDFDQNVAFDLIRQLTKLSSEELAAARPQLEKLAQQAQQPVIRQIGFVAIMTVDRGVDRAWELGTTSHQALRDLLAAATILPDQELRGQLFPKVLPLVKGLPEKLATPTSKKPGTIGRYVRIELPARGTLTLAEVEVISEGANVARRGKATQKNTAHGGDAKRGIDGNKNPSYGGGGQTHTEENTNKAWWELDLGEETTIDAITIYNRVEGNLGKRLDNFTLTVFDAARQPVFQQLGNKAPDEKVTIELGGNSPETTIRRAAMSALVAVRGQELPAFHTLCDFIRDDIDRLAAIRAMRQIPRKYWPADHAEMLLDATLGYIRKIPTADRTSPAALDAIEFAEALATLLPIDRARAVRAELSELGVRVIRLGTLFERMSYDQETVVVRAGKPIEILFENSDLMPHNLVITKPGALEELGLLAETSATDPAAQSRHFVPQSNKVLAASILLQPRESQRLSFTPPTEPGVYPYVCTYPGHWRRMYGAMYVVADLDAYLENPDAYLASHPLEIKDDLLKDRRPRTAWKLDELAPLVASLKDGRSFSNGKQMFKVATCIACHQMQGQGAAFGPDLLKLDPKKTQADVLRDIIEPSFGIHEKFKTNILELDDGRVLTGIVVGETPEELRLIENPLAKAEPTVIKKIEIAERTESKSSMMPVGLLDKLTREEILDLFAYIFSKGDEKHPLFSGGHVHK